MKRNFEFIIIFLILFFTLFISCKRKTKIPVLTDDPEYNLMLITLDTTRADRIGVYGYPGALTPNIDRLAENGVLFKNCYSSVPLTLPSHVTLFTGREPIAHHVRNNGNYVLEQKEETLAEIMKRNGFHTYAVLASFILHSKFGLNQGFNSYDDSLDFNVPVSSTRTEIGADKVYAKFKNWFKENNDKKFFSWIHFYDPHKPYNPPENYKERFKSDLYDGEIAFVDHFVGKIVDDLKSKNILNKTLIIVVGDHGEGFSEHLENGHGVFCYEETIKVPLIFSNPGIFNEVNRVVSNRVSLADIFPTVLHLFNIALPKDLQGKSLISYLFGNGEELVSQIYLESMYGKEDLGWAPLTGIIIGNYKYISLPKPELYNLKDDPKERKNLFLKKNSLAKEMDAKLRHFIMNNTTASTATKRKLTLSDKKKLETLGYISPFSFKAKKNLDPKDGIKILTEIQSVKELLDNGELDDAEKELTNIINRYKEVKIPQFYDALRNIYLSRKDFSNAVKVIEKAIKQFPGMERFKIGLALLSFGEGKIEKASQICQALIKEKPSLVQPYSLLGMIHKNRGEFEKAFDYYKKAREIEPLNTTIQVDCAEMEMEMRKPQNALKSIEPLLGNEVLMNDPDNDKIKGKIGIILAKLGEYDKAINLFLKIAANKNADVQVWTYLGLSYFHKGDFQKALESYNRSLELKKNDSLTLSSLGTLYITLFKQKKDTEFLTDAVKYYKRAIESDTNIFSAYNGLAIAYSMMRKNKEAISLWQKAIEIRPDFTNAYFNLGITLLNMHQKKEARKYLTICRDNYFQMLREDEQNQLLQLIAETGN